jgi:hypothetical protein
MSTFLQRKRAIDAVKAVKGTAMFGMVGGLILFLLGGIKWFFSGNPWVLLWATLFFTGAAFFLVGLCLPSKLTGVEKGFVKIAHGIGTVIFGLLLTIIFYLLLCPVGLFLRIIAGRAPFFSWSENSRRGHPLTDSFWQPKVTVVDHRTAAASAQRAPVILQLFAVLSYFIKHGHFIYLPILLILLVLGLMLFFLKSSSLAPFIYTIF